MIVCVGLLGACVVPVPAHNLKIQQRLIPHHNTPTHTHTRLPTTTHTDVNDMYIFLVFLSLSRSAFPFVRFFCFFIPSPRRKISSNIPPVVVLQSSRARRSRRHICVSFFCRHFKLPARQQRSHHHRRSVLFFFS